MARTQVSFATCNLFNLNEPGLPIYRDSDGWPLDQYELKVDWLSQTLRSLNADIWGFQELWHEQSLQNILESSGLSETHTALVPSDHSGQRIVCAAAVRSDILVGEPEWIEIFPDDFYLNSGGDDNQTSDISVQIDSFSRPVLHFEVKPRSNGKRVHVYVCHFKSKGPTKIYHESWYNKGTHSKHSEGLGSAISTIRRTAEAAALRMILVNQTKDTDTPVVVMGDINDSQQSNTLNILTGQPTYLSGLSKGGGDADLYSVGTLQEYRSRRDVYYTHVFQNVRESLDHILVSQEFYDNSKKRMWAFKGATINNDHLNTKDHKEDGTTDHGIVKATFEYRPA